MKKRYRSTGSGRIYRELKEIKKELFLVRLLQRGPQAAPGKPFTPRSRYKKKF